jgi:pyruvate,water dikinase
MKDMKYVVFLTERAPDPVFLGGKGSNLIRLVAIGANVPPGFIVNTNSYKKFLQESEYSNQLTDLLSKIPHKKEILSNSARIKDLILKSRIPAEIIDEITEAFDKIREEIGGGLSFAVRSSATIEDSGKFSFAGQADSYLYNKTFNEIIISIKNCWASLFSPRAMLYILRIRKMGMIHSLSDIQMAVVVQKMVNSKISGVSFTANVINNKENQMLINSAWGLGDTIANNSVIPDTIIINKDKFEIIKRIIGKKEKKSIQNPEGVGTIIVETDPQSGMICSLNEKQLRQLYNLGLRIESSFHFPQDIEWAIEDDVIYILQTRPITALIKM